MFNREGVGDEMHIIMPETSVLATNHYLPVITIPIVPQLYEHLSREYYIEETLPFLNMAMSQAANLAEKAMGHDDNAITEQDMTNPARDRAKYGDESETMKALAWMGKNHVQVSQSNPNPSLESSLTFNCEQSTLPSPKSSKIAMSS